MVGRHDLRGYTEGGGDKQLEVAIICYSAFSLRKLIMRKLGRWAYNMDTRDDRATQNLP